MIAPKHIHKRVKVVLKMALMNCIKILGYELTVDYVLVLLSDYGEGDKEGVSL